MGSLLSPPVPTHPSVGTKKKRYKERWGRGRSPPTPLSHGLSALQFQSPPPFQVAAWTFVSPTCGGSSGWGTHVAGPRLARDVARPAQEAQWDRPTSRMQVCGHDTFEWCVEFMRARPLRDSGRSSQGGEGCQRDATAAAVAFGDAPHKATKRVSP